MKRIDWRLEWQRLRQVRFSELTLEEGGGWPLLLRLLMCAVIVVIFSAGSLWFLAQPRAEQVEQARGRLEELKSRYSTRSFQAANLPLLNERMAVLGERMETLVSMLPTDAELPALLDDINESARRQQLEIDFIRLGDARVKPFYITQPFDIQVRGGYHALAEFVSSVAALPRIVTLHDMTLTPASEEGSAGEDLILSIQAETYRYDPSRDDGEEAP